MQRFNTFFSTVPDTRGRKHPPCFSSVNPTPLLVPSLLRSPALTISSLGDLFLSGNLWHILGLQSQHCILGKIFSSYGLDEEAVSKIKGQNQNLNSEFTAIEPGLEPRPFQTLKLAPFPVYYVYSLVNQGICSWKKSVKSIPHGDICSCEKGGDVGLNKCQQIPLPYDLPEALIC